MIIVNAPAARFPKFAARLSKACDEHADCPPLHKGRQVWLKERMAEHGLFVSVEGIRKWLAGETRPREEKAEILGKVLGVDPVRLRSGLRISSASTESADPESLPGAGAAPPLQIGIRPGLSVEIRGLPLDLSSVEAQKLANILLAHVTVE